MLKGIQSFPENISTLREEMLLQKGGIGYLTYIIDYHKDGVQIRDTSVVIDFSNVFLDDLHGLPSNREIEFAIELVEGTRSHGTS